MIFIGILDYTSQNMSLNLFAVILMHLRSFIQQMSLDWALSVNPSMN